MHRGRSVYFEAVQSFFFGIDAGWRDGWQCGAGWPLFEEIAGVERLEALMKVAVTASSADEFFAALDAEAAR